MYLSRVEIDIYNRRKIKDLTHAGAYHNWVESSFPKEFKENIRTRKLWRIDTLNDKYYLMVLSEEKPNLKLLERYGVESTGVTKSYDKLLDSLKIGQKMRFRVSLNPIISISEKGRKRGVVKNIIGDKNQRNFLLNRSKKNGFSLDENEFFAVRKKTEVLRKSSNRKEIFLKLDFEGILTITDVEKFKNIMINGLGKKKAFGCGLITVIPLE